MQHLDTETLSSYIDGELPAAEIAQVEAHLASCTQCDREYTELLGVSRMVRDLPTYQPRSSARVRSSSGGSRPERVISLTRYLRPVTVAAIVIIVAVTGLRIWPSSPIPNRTKETPSSSPRIRRMEPIRIVNRLNL